MKPVDAVEILALVMVDVTTPTIFAKPW